MGKLRTFASLANPVFRLYSIAMLLPMLFFVVQRMTTPLLVYRLTGSATLLGVVAMAGSIPQVFSSLFGGVIADRMQKKHVLLIAAGSFALVSSGLAVTLATGLLNAQTWWILMVHEALQSSLMGLMIPARHAVIREIVGREQLMNAVALSAMGAQLMRLAAPAAAGFLIDAFGFTVVFFILAAINAAGFIVITFLPRTGKIVPTTRNALQSVVDGFKYIVHERVLLIVLTFSVVGFTFSMPYQQLMPVFVDDIFKVGAKGMGMLMSASAIGSIAGGLIGASLPNRKRGLLLLSATILVGLALMGFSFSRVWPLALASMIGVGIGQSGRMLMSNTLVQHHVSDQYRGRVMGIYDLDLALVGPTVYVAGLVTEAIGVQWALGGMAMLLVLISLWTLLFVPTLRRLE
ncbi:MAG: MFS transporter [Chloroflexi bacterium]|nr:MFS transporter [Chloroflexota bacterium]